MVGRVLRPLLALACVALAVWQVRSLASQLARQSRAQELDTVAAMEGPFVVGVTREGVLTSSKQVSVQVPERLQWNATVTFIVPDGTQVKKGQLLAKLDISRYRFEVDGQKLEYQSALRKVGQSKRDSARDVEQAGQEVDRTTRSVEMLGKSTSVEQEQAQAQVGFDTWGLTSAQKDQARKERQRGFGLVPGSDLEEAQRTTRARDFQLTSSRKDVEQKQAESKIKQAQSATDIDTAKFSQTLATRRQKDSARSAQDEVKRSREALDRLIKDVAGGELRAPTDGVVVLGMAWDETGRHVIRAGDRAMWSVCSITDPRNLEVSVRIDEATASRVKVGQEVVVTAEGVPGRKFKGRVATVGSVAHTVDPWDDPNARPDQRVFDITVKILDADPKVLRPGMKAKATLVFRRLPKALFVPQTAVIHRPGKGEFVYVDEGGRYEECKVTTGDRNDEAVVVCSGLRAKQRVTVEDPTKLEAEP